jgi:hypothetical protein
MGNTVTTIISSVSTIIRGVSILTSSFSPGYARVKRDPETYIERILAYEPRGSVLQKYEFEPSKV